MPHRRGGAARLGIAVRPFLPAPSGERQDLLTPAERARLASITSLVRLERGATLFREGDEAGAIYDVADGILKTTAIRPDGGRAILGFFFPQDIVGLAENGRYVSTVQAVTTALLYRLPLPALERLLRDDSDLDYVFLMKACDELRNAQFHKLTLATARAEVRLARFLDMMRGRHPVSARPSPLVELPMPRADIAEYLGLVPESVSRAFSRLRRARLIACPTPHLVRILDEARLRAVAEEETKLREPSRGS